MINIWLMVLASFENAIDRTLHDQRLPERFLSTVTRVPSENNHIRRPLSVGFNGKAWPALS